MPPPRRGGTVPEARHVRTGKEENQVATTERIAYAAPGSPDSPVQLAQRYDNFMRVRRPVER